MAGLFFCLASAEGAGLLFCPAAIQPHTSVYSGLSVVNAKFMRPKRQNRLQGFTVAFPLICSIPAHAIQQSHKPPIHRLRSAGGHTVKCCTSTNTRYHRHAGRCTGATCPPTIIMYIRVQRCAPVVDLCQAVQHSADHASGGGTVQRQGHGGRRGTTSGLPPRLFSGFRPIANRGQQ